MLNGYVNNQITVKDISNKVSQVIQFFMTIIVGNINKMRGIPNEV